MGCHGIPSGLVIPRMIEREKLKCVEGKDRGGMLWGPEEDEIVHPLNNWLHFVKFE